MAGKLMHAVEYDKYGRGAAGLKHVEVPVPSPNKDEVLLKIEATSINPFDLRIQKGMARPILPRRFPFIPCTDVAGEVAEVGPGVKNFRTGDKVVAYLGPPNGGGLGEYAVAKETMTVARPPEVSAAEGSTIPIAAVTAYQALTQTAGIKLDATSSKQANILVTAASGGVGHFTVQLAKLGNTHVTATCGARNIEFMKSLGADEVLDYRTPEGAALTSPSGLKYDAVIHCAREIPWGTFEPNLSENGKHAEVPVPTPKKDEVLVKLEATSLNPVDWKIQKGMLRPFLPIRFPCIPGSDVAGEVVGVGSGVKNFKTGDKVVAMVSHLSGGGLAEFAAAKESLTVARPPEVSAAEGAALPVAGLTAHQALTQSAGIKLDGSGKRANVLITAASGGVGHFAVQLAKLGNTHVTATCGARNIEFVKSLGADEVLDYRTPDGAALKSPSGQKYDAVIHCAMGIPWRTFEPNLSENGKVIDITPGASAMMTFVLKKLTFSRKQLVPLLLIPKGKNLSYLVKLVKEGKLKAVIDSKYPLSKAEDAWAKSIESHATGKIIVGP